MKIKDSKLNMVSALIGKLFKCNCQSFSELSPEEASQEIATMRNKFFIPHPALPDLPLDFVDLVHVPQEMQFAIDCLPVLTKILQTYPKDEVVSLLDYGPGYCAGSNLFATLFRSNKLCCKVIVDAMDIKEFRKELINLDYPLVNFSVGDIKNVPLTKQWNIVYSSNVIEHLVDPLPLIADLIDHSDGWVIIYAPYEEINLSLGHASTITEDTFKQFDPVTMEIKDSLAWAGKQILALFKGKGQKSSPQ
jgi:SAM-dependent methyltransferase